jgi:hypothetical protein
VVSLSLFRFPNRNKSATHVNKSWVARIEGAADARAAGDIVFTLERPSTADPIPAGLDWDLWLGPAPERPFHSVYFPGPKWYRWWDFANFKRPEPTIEKSLGHHQEWIHGCKTGAPTMCNFEYAGWLTEANHLGNVAYRTGKKLQWDAGAMRATNAPEADPFIRRQYRKGWDLAGLA